MEATVSGVWVIIGVLLMFGLGTVVHSLYSWYTSGEPFIGRKFTASTVDALQVAFLQGVAVAEVQSQTELTLGLFLVLLFNCLLAGAGVVAISSKTKKNSNAVATLEETVNTGEHPEFPGDQS
jgi:hypothetical protein